MRIRPISLSWLIVLLAVPAFADYGSPPPPRPTTPATSTSSSGGDMQSSAREEAERHFSDAYDDVVKAGKEADKGKKDNAEKKYRRALDRSQQAVSLDSTYAEAWNLVGFTSRKLGNYPQAFAAYTTALRLKPDFALAMEYYGEGLLETGDLAGARKQLAALRKSGTPELIAELEGSINKYVAAHPEKSAANGTAAAESPPADTSYTPAAK